jgi:choline dehydrogenase-like flavoprotein
VEPDRFDDLVLGGGAAGCVLAARLSEDAGRSVCLVEAGPDYGPLAGGGWPDDLIDPHQLPASHDWHLDDGFGWSARVIGGCSAHNACLITWGAAADYDGWGHGWSAAALEPHRRRAEEAIGVQPRAEVGAWHEAVHAAAVEAGFAPVVDLNAPDASTGVGRAAFNDRGGVRRNAAIAYLDGARDRPNLTILDRTLVDRLELDGTRAHGASVIRAGRRTRIEAARILLCAGAYGSPAILLRSGIGPATELACLGIAPVVDLPGVGENLQNHWTARAMIDPGPDLRRRVDAEAAAGGVHMAGTVIKAESSLCDPGLWDIHLFAVAWAVRDEHGDPTGERVFRIATSVLRPRSVGRVTLASANPEAAPAIDHRPLSDPGGSDLAVLAEGVGLAARVASAPSLRELGVTVEAPVETTGAALRQHARASLGCYFHPVGTCAIGRVVDGACAVYGVDGVHVGDCSVMPSIPRANTHLSALAVAERLAGELSGPGTA